MLFLFKITLFYYKEKNSLKGNVYGKKLNLYNFVNILPLIFTQFIFCYILN